MYPLHQLTSHQAEGSLLASQQPYSIQLTSQQPKSSQLFRSQQSEGFQLISHQPKRIQLFRSQSSQWFLCNVVLVLSLLNITGHCHSQPQDKEPLSYQVFTLLPSPPCHTSTRIFSSPLSTSAWRTLTWTTARRPPQASSPLTSWRPCSGLLSLF